MGAGKTTFGRRLSRALERPFRDTDELLVAESGANIQSWFEERGEAAFRAYESAMLENTIQTFEGVVATGGGLPAWNNNMDRMLDSGIPVYLAATPEILFQRLKRSRSHRPSIRHLDDEGLRVFIQNRLQERVPVYERAPIHVSSHRLKDAATVQHVSERITRIEMGD